MASSSSKNSATFATGHLTGNFSPGPGTIFKRYMGFRTAISASVKDVTAAIWSNLRGPSTRIVSTDIAPGKVFCGKMPCSA